MEVCGYAPDLKRSGGSWTAYHMSFKARIYPFFMPNPDLIRIDDGFITEAKTGWVMHNSNQNFCYHVHYRGTCYSFEDLTPISDASYPDLPIWRLVYKNPRGIALSKSINYAFPMRTCFDVLDTQTGYDGVFPGWRQVEAQFGVVNVCERIPNRIHPAWDCYAMLSTLSVIYKSADYKSAAFGRLPDPGSIIIINSSTRLYIYLFGKYTTPSAIGYVTGRLYQNPWTKEIKFTPDLSTVNWYNSISDPVTEVETVSQEIAITTPTYDDRAFFNPEIAFGFNWDWEAAMTQALNQVNFFDSNGMAFAHDVASLPTTILSDVNNLSKLTKIDPSGKAKIVASAFLSVHYGYKLLVQDATELIDELTRYTTTHTLHVGQTVDPDKRVVTVGDCELISASGHLNVYYDPYAQLITEVGKFVEAVDLSPDFSNIWDMIPFSFVVDWFTNVGDLASGIDNYFTLTQQHKVLGCIRSRKISYIRRPAGFFGSVLCTRYTRSPSEGWFPVPKFSFQFQNPVTDLYHWIEGLALVVSKKA